MKNKEHYPKLAQPKHAKLQEKIGDKLALAKQNEDRAFVTALGRGLLLLSVFEHEQQLSHQQICDQTRLPKATVSRLIHTLETLGFINKNDNETYHLGKNLLKLSASAWHRHDLAEGALPLLKEFALNNQVSVNIASESDGEMRYLACYRSPARLAVNLSVGSTVPIEKTAIGRAYYASLASSMQSQTLQAILLASPSNDLQQIKAKLQHASEFYQQHGYCLSDGEYSPDILAVALPLYDHAKGEYSHSLNASVPKVSWDTDDYIAFIVPKLRELATKIEAL